MQVELESSLRPAPAAVLLVLAGSIVGVCCLLALVLVQRPLVPWGLPSFVLPLPALLGLVAAALPGIALLARRAHDATVWSLFALLERAAASFSAFVPVWFVSLAGARRSTAWLELAAHLAFVALATGCAWQAEAGTRPPMPRRSGRSLLPWWCLGLVVISYAGWACIRYGARLLASGGAWLVVVEVLALAAVVKGLSFALTRALAGQSEPRWSTEEARDWVGVFALLWVAGLGLTMIIILVLLPSVMLTPGG